MIMIGAGTGLAPFRGILQERAAQQAGGLPVATSSLFFGCRTSEDDDTMAPGVRTALIQVLRMKSPTSTDGNNWLAGLRADGRFLEDIWGG
jgi:sulfite reductase alpha subunit-like flavoprotein